VLVLLQVLVGIAVTFAVLFTSASVLGGAVGSVELMLLAIPSALVGVWAGNRVRARARAS
jgi:uncharacterized membrane protein YfcA